MSAGARICIASSGCLSTGPRVVKEADALAAAGHAVHVVVRHWMPEHAEWDERLARGRPWTWSALPMQGWTRFARPISIAGIVLQRLGRGLLRHVGPLAPVDELAASDLTLELGMHLARQAAEQRCDLFIAHNLAALPATAWIARRERARLAFDAEDDHLGELSEAEQQSPEGRLRDVLLARHLARCDHVTVPSEGIGERLSIRYGIARPTVVHNVFPWEARRALDGLRRDRVGRGPSLHWYSQSLGLDRGLQDAIRALAFLPREVELHLRGRDVAGARAVLEALAREVGVAERVRFHSPVHPDELLSRVAEHDVGLALEQPVSDNRMQTVTNKLFFYLLAGLALAVTDTPGQRRILRDLPEVGVLCPAGDHAALASALGALVGDPTRLAQARRASLAAAEQRWCWEKERRQLMEVVERTLRAPPRSS